MKRFSIPGLCMLLLAIAAGFAPAIHSGEDHSGLREALARKEIVSFETILEWIEQRYVGEIVEVELENEDHEMHYEVDLLSPHGDLIEFDFDARTGKVLNIEGQNIERARRK